jgi:hypothetical protein
LEENLTKTQIQLDCALENNEGYANTAIGRGALASNVNGGNTALGYVALVNNVSGSDNVAVGSQHRN